MKRVYGAHCDVAGVVRTHLFGIAPNNSGSTFLRKALATSRATWNLPREGQHALGFAGPRSLSHSGRIIWGAERDWLERLGDTGAYDWPRTRRAWYFQAYARDAQASVFYTNTPHFLLFPGELALHFPNAKFLFMVRNPYAVCEGICRWLRGTSLARGRDLPDAAARHVVACFDRQRRNLDTHGQRGAFFTYEAMCDDPGQVEGAIRALVPELDDLRLAQRLPVKNRYREMLTNLNAPQIARLDSEAFTACNRVFRRHRGLLGHFGYEIMEPGN